MKKFFVLLFMAVMLLNNSVSAFNFPEPDWGALLKERRKLESEIDFELYTEGSVEAAPYYGARLEPRGGTYIGMIAERAEPFKPIGSYETYIECTWQTDLYYPANVMVEQDNVITMIGYNIYDTNSIDYNEVRQTLDTLAGYNKPMLIRFAGEMNDGQLGVDPTAYVDMFRNVANMVHEYPNFAVVWSPIDLGALDRNFIYYYPGDEYVDWIGISSYAFKYFQGDNNTAEKNNEYFMTKDYAWHTVKLKPIIKFMEENNIKKPVMISEGGVATNGKYGDDYQSWAAPRLKNMLYYVAMKYPHVKMINYFNVFRENESERFNITEFSYASQIYNEAKDSGAYIKEYGGSPEFVYQKASESGTLKTKDGLVNLYTMAYIPKKPDITVTYRIDGNWYHHTSEIPYKCSLDVNAIADGEHTIEIQAENQKKSYTFYKKGNSISFNGEPDTAVNESSTQAGTTKAYNTDIYVYINESAIPSYAVNGTSVVVAEDLRNYGFHVIWNNDTRTLDIYRNEEGAITPLSYVKTEPPGSFFSDVYASDIVVNLNGQRLTSYAIDGVTLIPIEEFGMYYSVQYNDFERALRMNF